MTHNLIYIYKNEGETLAELLGRVRQENGISSEISLTYAGRLDPMAEGMVLVLVGDECKKKDEYLGLYKTYEYEVLFGIETDTFDVLGIPYCVMPDEIRHPGSGLDSACLPQAWIKAGMTKLIRNILPQFLGKITQTYPPYSSKTINGVPLFQLARDGKLKEDGLSREAVCAERNLDKVGAKCELPKIDIEIYEHEFLGLQEISRDELLAQVRERIQKVSGDFRQFEILSAWSSLQLQTYNSKLVIASFRISCSSGTYIRRIASDMGHLLGTGALAWKIKRTKVEDYMI